MATCIKLLWSSAKCTKDQANQIAELVNRSLTLYNKCTVIEITEAWWGIAGNPKAEERLKALQKHAGIESEQIEA